MGKKKKLRRKIEQLDAKLSEQHALLIKQNDLLDSHARQRAEWSAARTRLELSNESLLKERDHARYIIAVIAQMSQGVIRIPYDKNYVGQQVFLKSYVDEDKTFVLVVTDESGLPVGHSDYDPRNDPGTSALLRPIGDNKIDGDVTGDS